MDIIAGNDQIEITLKEITDMIDVRHNDSMSKIEALQQEPSFGLLRKTRISYAKGKETETYVLNKKQAIAAAARLNNKMLMMVIDRLEELENASRSKALASFDMVNKKLLALFHQGEAIGEVITEHEQRIKHLENSSTIDSRQQGRIQVEVGRRVVSIIEKHNFGQDVKSKLFARVYKMLKRHFEIGSYKDIPKARYDEAVKLIREAPFGGLL